MVERAFTSSEESCLILRNIRPNLSIESLSLLRWGQKIIASDGVGYLWLGTLGGLVADIRTLDQSSDPAAMLSQVDEISQLCSLSIEEIREIAYRLHPHQLDQLGLSEAIQVMAEKVRLVIVDDHPLFRNGLKQVIEADPHFQLLAEAGDGQTALDQIRMTWGLLCWPSL